VSTAPELIPSDVVGRHQELCAQLVAGVGAMCSALWRIRSEQTYTAQGCKSFGEFLSRSGMSASSGRMYANLGPVMLELQRRGKADLVKNAEMLKPIHLMISKAAREHDEAAATKIAMKQAQLVVLAAAVAERGLRPLTADEIEDVAEKNYGWLPARKRKAKRDANPPEQRFEHPFRTDARELIAIAQGKLAGMSAENAVQYAYVHRLPGFEALARWFVDVLDEAQRFDRNTPDLWSGS